MKSCPRCSSQSGLREILYGFLDGPVDEEKYSIGGCCITDDDPTLKCIKCGWKGENVNHIQKVSKKISAVQLQDISIMSDAEINSYAQQIWQKLARQNKGE